MSFKPTAYSLFNVADGHIFEDSVWTIADPASQSASLVRAIYENKKFSPDAGASGLYRYHSWMPVKRQLEGSCAPVTYKSEGLAQILGLKNLYIIFNGWNPARGAEFKTCSFKETEAYSVCARLAADEKRTLVVASAGNTARAFASVCSRNNIPLVVSIPYDNLSAMWFDEPLNPCVKVIASPAGSDYFDAISLGDKLCQSPEFLAEGGAKNIARRDGMGTTILSAVEACGVIPDAYFQAVGSGTGAIAAWENNHRLIDDGNYGDKKMKLMLSQNVPFTIMTDSWNKRSRTLVEITPDRAREASAEIKAKVLSNRKPPYSLAGGLFDALSDTDGRMYSVTNDELDSWTEKFESAEGIDICPAAAVATASLAKAIANGDIKENDVIALNITGGGEALRKKELGEGIYYAEPAAVLDPATSSEEIVNTVKNLF